ncbi:MAG: hypothetical protein EOP83_33950, partial [Verrucomicrobiaceae bacterium]
GYMGEFHAAGGVPRLLSELTDLLDLTAPRAFGGTIGDSVEALSARHEEQIIRSRSNPISQSGSIAVLTGNLAPRGAVIKHAAADPKLQVHEGRAVVFDSVKDMTERLDDPALNIAADDILVLRNAGPKGAPGMPEAGYIPIPRHLARQGVKDMVRISDARMSGTAFGTIVLHITPESADGGPLGAVRTGDRIRLDVPDRTLNLLVTPEELVHRMATNGTQATGPERGYAQLYDRHVTQADMLIGTPFHTQDLDRAIFIPDKVDIPSQLSSDEDHIPPFSYSLSQKRFNTRSGIIETRVISRNETWWIIVLLEIGLMVRSDQAPTSLSEE